MVRTSQPRFIVAVSCEGNMATDLYENIRYTVHGYCFSDRKQFETEASCCGTNSKGQRSRADVSQCNIFGFSFLFFISSRPHTATNFSESSFKLVVFGMEKTQSWHTFCKIL